MDLTASFVKCTYSSPLTFPVPIRLVGSQTITSGFSWAIAFAYEDLEAYTSLDDLMGKCEYYLSHDKERREIAHNGFEKVKKYHTYDIRLTQMLEIAFGLK